MVHVRALLVDANEDAVPEKWLSFEIEDPDYPLVFRGFQPSKDLASYFLQDARLQAGNTLPSKAARPAHSAEPETLSASLQADIAFSIAPTRMANQTGLRYHPKQRKEADQNGLPQISARFHNFAAGCARGLHSTTKLAGPEGENRASNGGGEARCPGGGGRDTRGLEPRQATRFEHCHKRAVAEPAFAEALKRNAIPVPSISAMAAPKASAKNVIPEFDS
jgi:hypothetical protein